MLRRIPWFVLALLCCAFTIVVVKSNNPRIYPDYSALNISLVTPLVPTHPFNQIKDRSAVKVKLVYVMTKSSRTPALVAIANAAQPHVKGMC